MRINILTIGTRMPQWVIQGYEEFAKRLSAICPLNLIEIPPEKRVKNSDVNQLIQKEGLKILSILTPGNLVVALEVSGKSWSTLELANQVKRWQQMGRNIDLIIGGADGLSTDCLARAEIKWSLSPLTFPHALVRIIVAEQLYRAFSIIQKHPYHRE